MIREGEEIICAIIGGSKCGKTTLGKALVFKMWRLHRLRAIIFDPFRRKNNWGASAWVTDDLEKFKRAVWGTKHCAVFWDESTDSINKHDREDQKFFSRIRHEHKAFFLLCHDLTVMSPLMRGNLSDMYVFRQGVKRAGLYAEDFADQDLQQLAELGQYEFIHKQPFRPARRLRPTTAEMQNVI